MLRKGFTLIELLIVIAVLSILAVAVLSAINPVEQLRKARDAARKSDSAELLNADERYFTTFGCWPWENTAAGGGCTVLCDPSADNPRFPVGSGCTATTVDVSELLTRQEMKQQFTTRRSITDDELKVTEDTTNSQVSVCFTPESSSGRGGGLGPIMNETNTALGTGCAATYVPTEAECNVCVPQ